MGNRHRPRNPRYVGKIGIRNAAECPALSAALDYLRAGDTLVVRKLDRLGRLVKDVLRIADDLHARCIGVRILTGRYSPAGEGKFFTMMAVFAELERDISTSAPWPAWPRRRPRAALAAAPTVMDADKLAAARARRARGESPATIAKALGVSRASIYRHLAAESE
jgi:DNA invertase Pin-like site-specific DNA recombinase